MRWRQADRGSVTVELAVGLPVVVLVVLAVLGVTAAGVTQQRCAEAARVAARAATLGEDDAEVTATARHVAGDAAAVSVVRDGAWVSVSVEDTIGLPAAVLDGALRVGGTATARVEP